MFNSLRNLTEIPLHYSCTVRPTFDDRSSVSPLERLYLQTRHRAQKPSTRAEEIELMRRGSSDEHGHFSLSGRGAGSYRLWAAKDSYSPLATRVELRAGEPVTGLELKLAPVAGLCLAAV